MHRVEPVKGLFLQWTARTALPVIEPDQHKGQRGGELEHKQQCARKALPLAVCAGQVQRADDDHAAGVVVGAGSQRQRSAAPGTQDYTCKYKPTAWENFYFIYVGENKDDKQTWYGCEPVDGKLFNLATENSWNLWFKDDVTGEEMTVTVDLNTMTWKYE